MARDGSYLGIHFKCCNVYGRIYKNPAGTQYMGHCPKCMKKVTAKIGSGGTDQRFFEAN